VSNNVLKHFDEENDFMFIGVISVSEPDKHSIVNFIKLPDYIVAR